MWREAIPQTSKDLDSSTSASIASVGETHRFRRASVMTPIKEPAISGDAVVLCSANSRCIPVLPSLAISAIVSQFTFCESLISNDLASLIELQPRRIRASLGKPECGSEVDLNINSVRIKALPVLCYNRCKPDQIRSSN